MQRNRTGILIVDDERAVRLALSRCLARDGYEVTECGDPFEAVELAEENDFALIICDYQMPGMLGLDVLRRIKLVKPDTIRIILTAHADLSMAIRAINEGEIYRFLVKPWDNQELLSVVRRAIEERATESAEESEVSEETEVLERAHPGISDVQRDERGAVVIEDSDTTILAAPGGFFSG